MNRFFGMMPSTEIERQERFVDTVGLKITIQSGPNGYSILYADGSSQFKDIKDSTDNNFKIAYDIAKGNLGELKPVNEPCCREC